MPIPSNANIITSTGQVSDNVIRTADIADSQVTPAKISNGNVGDVMTMGASAPAWVAPASIPTGTIAAFAAAAAPTGYLICDGTAVSRATYAALFAVVATTYGIGDGSTTFNLPDLKGKVIVGFSAGETEFDVLGETGGEKTHLLTVPEIPSHTHPTIINRGQGGSSTMSESGNAAYNWNGNSGATGGGGAHNNLQPYMALNFIIKT